MIAKIEIVGRTPEVIVSYDDGVDTAIVESKLTKAFGNGILINNATGNGIAVEKLVGGNYSWTITDPQQEGVSITLSIVFTM